MIPIKTIINNNIITGWIIRIKSLSPKPIEFNTIASEFLYNCENVIIIERKRDITNIIGVSLSILKLNNGIKSLIGMLYSIASWAVNTNWLPNTISEIIKNIAKNINTRLLKMYLAILLFKEPNIFNNFILRKKFIKI
mgnify:CR=1 FL=1